MKKSKAVQQRPESPINTRVSAFFVSDAIPYHPLQSAPARGMIWGMVTKSKTQLPPDRLTDAMAADAQPSSKPHKLTDGGGLYLLVNPNGSRYWRFRYRFNGKQNTLSCGVFPEDTLGEARARRDSFRAMLAAGVNPSLQVVADKARALAVGDPRFTIDNTGTLAVHLGKRVFALTAAETSELRAFLDATRTITGETPCP